MKLKEIYQPVLSKFKELKETKRDVLLEHIKMLKEAHEFSNLETRIAYDCGRFCFPPAQICIGIKDTNATMNMLKRFL